MSTASQQLLDLAAAHQGGVTDYRLGKLSGFAQNTVSRWRTGTGHMGPQAVIKFCELAGIKDVMRWHVLVGCEREPGPNGDVWRSLRDELTLSTKAGKPVKGGMIDALVRSIAGKAAGLAGAVIAAAMLAHPQDVRAATLERSVWPENSLAAQGSEAGRFIHYAKYMMQAALRWLPVRACFTARRPAFA